MKKLIIVLVVILAGVFNISAETATDMTYLTGFGARQRGMGGAFVAVSGEPLGAFNNPAGLAFLTDWYLGGAFTRFSEKTTNGMISLAGPFPGSNTVIAIAGNFDQTFDIKYPLGDYFSTFDGIIRVGQISVAHHFPLGLAVLAMGGSTRITRFDGNGSSDYGCTFDFGIQYHLDEASGWTLGAVFRDIEIAKLESGLTGEFQQTAGVLGLSYHKPDSDSDWGFIVNADIMAVENQSVKPLLGVEAYRELSFPVTLSFRSGYNGDGLTAGFGIKWKMLSMDYAISRTPDIEELAAASHSINFTIRPLELLPQTGSDPDTVRAQYRRERYEYLMGVVNSLLSLPQLDYPQIIETAHKATAFVESNSPEYNIADSIVTSIEAILDSIKQAEFDSQMADLRIQLENLFADSILGIMSNFDGSLAGIRDSIDFQRGFRLSQIHADVVFADNIFRNRKYDLSSQLLDSCENSLASLKLEYQAPRRFAATEQAIRDLRNRLNNGRALERDMRMLAAARALQTDSLTQAWEHYTIALDLTKDGNYPPALQGRKQVLIRMAELIAEGSPIVTPLNRSQILNSAEVDSLYNEGVRFNREENYQRAIDMWEQVLVANPSHPTVKDDIETARARMATQE